MNELAAAVTAALERSILPSVIARGAATIRVVAAGDDGMITLEADGSPGAVLPILGRIEAQIRAAVPGVTAVRLATGSPTAADSPGAPRWPAEAEGLTEAAEARDLGAAARRILDAEVNPSIAAHRGRVSVVGADGGWIRIRLEGGCQGCSLAEVTIRQGIEPLLRARLADLVGVADVTDHEAGSDPFFSPEKR